MFFRFSKTILLGIFLSVFLLANFSGFAQEAQDRIEIKSSSQIEKGFQVGIKGEDTHYDFSDEGITESLSVFLNPAIAELIAGKKNG